MLCYVAVITLGVSVQCLIKKEIQAFIVLDGRKPKNQLMLVTLENVMFLPNAALIHVYLNLYILISFSNSIPV